MAKQESRIEHLNWCKKRALEYLDRGDRKNAVSSMLSDLRKHPENASFVGMAAMLSLTVKTDKEARDFIEGFN